jgi:hypothetical protein
LSVALLLINRFLYLSFKLRPFILHDRINNGTLNWPRVRERLLTAYEAGAQERKQVAKTVENVGWLNHEVCQ